VGSAGWEPPQGRLCGDSCLCCLCVGCCRMPRSPPRRSALARLSIFLIMARTVASSDCSVSICSSVRGTYSPHRCHCEEAGRSVYARRSASHFVSVRYSPTSNLLVVRHGLTAERPPPIGWRLTRAAFGEPVPLAGQPNRAPRALAAFRPSFARFTILPRSVRGQGAQEGDRNPSRAGSPTLRRRLTGVRRVSRATKGLLRGRVCTRISVHAPRG
jgi:hypothetical protein